MQKLFLQTRQLIHVITEMICYFRYQNFSKAYRLSARVMVLFQEMMEALVEEGMEDIAENFLPVLQAALEASESQDGMRIADLFEAGILPDLMHLQQGVFGAADDILCDFWGKNRQYIKEKNPELYRRILEARENISDDYQINWAETGDIVLSMETESGTVRTNSLINPWREAILYASKTISCEDSEYIVVGFGLGYHIEQILKQSYGQKVTVLEQDINQLAIAFSYRDLSELLQKDNLNLIFASDIDVYTEYMARMSENGKVCIWDASVKSIANTELKEFLENQQIERASIENQKGFLFYNFCQNILLKDKEVSSLKEIFVGKTMLLIAGGPSLDSAIETLRNMDRQDIVTVCVGKVAKKLVKLGILPDYIVMIDAQPSTRWQTRDIERCGVPLIYLSTTASSVVSSYEGERYIAYQEGLKMAEKKALSAGWMAAARKKHPLKVVKV